MKKEEIDEIKKLYPNVLIIIEYDPILGITLPDIHLKDELEYILRNYTKHKNHLSIYSYGNETFVLNARLLVSRNLVKPYEIIFIFKGEIITINEYGRLNPWPNGFCDNEEKISEEISRTAFNIYVRKENEAKNGK